MNVLATFSEDPHSRALRHLEDTIRSCPRGGYMSIPTTDPWIMEQWEVRPTSNRSQKNPQIHDESSGLRDVAARFLFIGFVSERFASGWQMIRAVLVLDAIPVPRVFSSSRS
jgi:hypothetical protein